MISNYSDLLGGALIAYLLLVPILGSVVGLGTYIIIVVANRSDPDPTGKRPISVYMFAAAFITLWLAFIGSVVIVSSLIGLIGTNYGTTMAIHPVGDSAARGATIGALLLIVAGALYALHRRRGLALADSESDPASPTKRVARSYVSAVSFISIILAVVVTIAALYTIFGIIAPGVYEAGSRVSSAKGLLDELYVLLAALVVFGTHQSLAPTSLRLFRGHPHPAPAAAVPEAPVTPAGDTEA